MTILFDATRPVKPTHTRRFAAGLLACLPVTHLDHTHADADAYAQLAADLDQATLADEDDGLIDVIEFIIVEDDDPYWDELADDSSTLDAACDGCLPY